MTWPYISSLLFCTHSIFCMFNFRRPVTFFSCSVVRLCNFVTLLALSMKKISTSPSSIKSLENFSEDTFARIGREIYQFDLICKNCSSSCKKCSIFCWFVLKHINIEEHIKRNWQFHPILASISFSLKRSFFPSYIKRFCRNFMIKSNNQIRFVKTITILLNNNQSDTTMLLLQPCIQTSQTLIFNTFTKRFSS